MSAFSRPDQTKQTLSIDYNHYEIDQILEGGMGRVLLLTRFNSLLHVGPMAGMLECSDFLSDHFRSSSRNKLAAKTVKEKPAMPSFQRECQIWLSFSEPGIVPLLKVVRVGDEIFALMPRYAGNLRELLAGNNKLQPLDFLKMLETPVRGLSALYERQGIVHQDIKPENLLFKIGTEGASLFVSDWGMANVHASIFPKQEGELSQFVLATMGGCGTIPYMAPERFASYTSDVRADIFSLGIVFLEIIVGHRPYDRSRSIPEQIITGESYQYARKSLEHCPKKISGVVLSMIHPNPDTRLHEYRGILKCLRSL